MSFSTTLVAFLKIFADKTAKAAYTFNGTSHADIPEKFQQYEF